MSKNELAVAALVSREKHSNVVIKITALFKQCNYCLSRYSQGRPQEGTAWERIYLFFSVRLNQVLRKSKLMCRSILSLPRLRRNVGMLVNLTFVSKRQLDIYVMQNSRNIRGAHIDDISSV